MGNRVSTESDSLTVKIGGDPENRKKKKASREGNRIKSTKYNLFTFLPQNLLEQFRRIANFYFLVMVVISLVIDSPVSPLTSLIPLLFVVVVTATKQGYEDFLRHKADNMVNFSLVTVIRDGKEQNIFCQDIMKGDLVLVLRDCDVPCDLVLLKSSDVHGKCFITTANLDGETNLKTLNIPKGLPTLEVEKLHTMGFIECEQPKTDLYSFSGKIELASSYRVQCSYTLLDESAAHHLPLCNENILLRGSRVRNTEQVIGCAVYTGQATKLALNSRLTRSKVASSEAYINKFLIFILIVLLAIVTFSYFLKRYYDMHYVFSYLGPNQITSDVRAFFQDYFSFLILFNYLIPISLYVTIELNKFLGSFFMEWDLDLYCPVLDQPCIVNTSDLNEELGQVNILFSDKTGTLTKNEMLLHQCSINGKKYKYNETTIQEENKTEQISVKYFNNHQQIFFTALSLCHTVQLGGSFSDELDETNNEKVQDIYTFTDIREENTNISRNDSEVDETDFVLGGRSHRNEFDVNPLLRKPIIGSIRRKLDSERIITISPNASRTNIQTNNIQQMSISQDALSTEISIRQLSNGDRIQNGRPFSMLYNRSTSSIEELNSPSFHSNQTHRRTQSYGAPSTFQRQSALVPRAGSLRRNPSTRSNKSRESYASPSYINYTPNETTVPNLNITNTQNDLIKARIGALDYQASSPDEKALVEACTNLGMCFVGDDNDIITIDICPPDKITENSWDTIRKLYFKRLLVLEFTSDRKRMSVIVKDNNGDIWVYTKGAESYVFPLCNPASRNSIVQTNSHINDFSKQGLRTLAIARRKMSENEFQTIYNEILQANMALENRTKLLEECYGKIEKNLELVGATAVEDALQDDVRNTLELLQAAGISIWVLTGDKIETAHNIALSCGHIPDGSRTYFITECQSCESVEEHLKIVQNEQKLQPEQVYCILIDGKSLAIALKELPDKFREVSLQCKAVLCCRLSPLQKCEVVHLIKNSDQKYITAAIGDGANDVSMIQEAHVGLGIVGKEGRQAARCADYAFATFSMLRPVLLIHGHYYSHRLALLVLYFFYKNAVFMGIQFFFQFDNIFSSESIYDSLFLTLYNVLYTALPILVISLTEKPYSKETLMSNPALYQVNTQNRRLHWDRFLGWVFLAVIHAAIIYYFALFIWQNDSAILSTPYVIGLSCFGTFLIHNVVVLVNMKLWLEAIYQSYYFIASIWLSILAFALSTLIYNFINLLLASCLLGCEFFSFLGESGNSMYYVYNILLSSITFWLLSVLVVVASLIPDFTMKAITKALHLHVRLFPGSKKNKDRYESNIVRIQNGNHVESTCL